MKYSILSIDDTRAPLTANIRDEMDGHEEIEVFCVDARPEGLDLDAELAKSGLAFANHWKEYMWKPGDIGGYLSHFNAWEAVVDLDEPLLVFEDDAQVPVGFAATVEEMLAEMPPDFGALSLCVISLEVPVYRWHQTFDEWGQPRYLREIAPGEPNPYDYGADLTCRAYQSWVLTASVISPIGARALIDSSRRLGVHMNADAFVWHRSHVGDLDGYAPKPQHLYRCPQFYEGPSLIAGR